MKKSDRGLLAIERMFDGAVDRSMEISPPSILYHYTSRAGAEGIIRNQSFWATAHDCTNDQAELRSADEIIMDEARRLRNNSSGIARELMEFFLNGYPQFKVTRVMTVYLACFSNARDDKEQWRKYGDEGRGLCLGLRVLNEPEPHVADLGSKLLQVDYSETSWRASINRHFQAVLTVVRAARRTTKGMEMALSALYRIAAFMAISAKREEWSSEREYRYTTILHPAAGITPRERLSGEKKIRFLPVLVRAQGKRIAFAEILIGVNQEFAEAHERLKKLLSDVGYKPGEMEYPEISRSSVEL